MFKMFCNKLVSSCEDIHTMKLSDVAASRGCSTSKLSYPTIRRTMWSTLKPCRTEKMFIMLLDFIFHWPWNII